MQQEWSNILSNSKFVSHQSNDPSKTASILLFAIIASSCSKSTWLMNSLFHWTWAFVTMAFRSFRSALIQSFVHADQSKAYNPALQFTQHKMFPKTSLRTYGKIDRTRNKKNKKEVCHLQHSIRQCGLNFFFLAFQFWWCLTIQWMLCFKKEKRRRQKRIYQISEKCLTKLLRCQ